MGGGSGNGGTSGHCSRPGVSNGSGRSESRKNEGDSGETSEHVC